MLVVFRIHTNIQKFGFYSKTSLLHCYRKFLFQINAVFINFLFIKEHCITVASTLLYNSAQLGLG